MRGGRRRRRRRSFGRRRCKRWEKVMGSTCKKVGIKEGRDKMWQQPPLVLGF
jgi:hypothetical protein